MDESRSKLIFAHNLRKYMLERDLKKSDIMEITSAALSTVGAWLSADKYPRMDKVQLLADYLGIQKSQLIDEPPVSDMMPEIYADIVNGNVEFKQVKRVEISDELGKKILDFFKRNPELIGIITTKESYTEKEAEKIINIVKLIIDD